ncbi:Protein kinase domain-containing protein [Psidium guajava]|nr:Protein kinase domain-containing protein [Psidium guajava]
MVATTSFNSAHLFTTFCLLLFSLQLSRRSSALATAGAVSLIQNLCSQTLEVDACKNCVSSDPTDDIPELIYSVLFCMYTQAVYGHVHADEISRAATSAGVKRALRVCRDTLFAASNDLSDALSMVEGSEYRDAFVNMKKSRWSLISCALAFRSFATGDGDAIPALLINDMVLMKRLFDVGHYFFRLIIKINDR